MEIDQNKISQSREAGYSDEEIGSFLSQKDPEFQQKYNQSIESGYSPSEILNFVSKPVPEKQFLQKEQPKQEQGLGTDIARVGMQAAIGLSEGMPLGMAYDIGAKAINLGKKFPNQDEGLDIEIPTIGETFHKLGEKLGVDTTPKTPLEKFARTATSLRAVAEAGVLQVEKAGSYAYQELKKIASIAPLAASAVAAEEVWGIPQWASFITGGFGVPVLKKTAEVTGHLVRKGINESMHFDVGNLKLKNPISSFRQEWGNARKEALKKVEEGVFSKEQYENIKPFLDIAAQYNIPVNLGAFSDSAYLRRMEKTIAENEITGEAARKFRQEAAEGWANSVIDLTKRISQTAKFSQQGEVAESLLSDITRNKHKELQKEYTELYGKSSTAFADSENLASQEMQQLENSLNNISEKVGSSLVPTTAETSTKGLAREAAKNLTISPEKAGLPEFGHIEFRTGKEALAAEEKAAGEALQEKVTARITAKEEAEKAKQTFIEKRRKKGKREAKRQLQEKSEKAFKAGQTVEHEAERARTKVLEAEEKQAETLFKSQQDLEDVFGPSASNMKLDENGRIKFVRPVNGKTLVDTIRSLNSFIEWETPEVRNLFKDFLNENKRILGKVYGKSNPEAYKDYLKANETFGKTQKIFGDNAAFKKWGIKSDATPEELLNTIKTPTRFKEFEKEFGNTDQGRMLIDELKRLKVEEQLVPIFDQVVYKPGQISGKLRSVMRDPWMNYLMPAEVKNDLKQLSALDAQIQRTSAPVYRNSESFQQSEDALTKFLLLMNPKAWPIKLGMKMADQRSRKAFANVLFDPNITHKMVQIGKDLQNARMSPNSQPSTFKYIKAEIDDMVNNIIQAELAIGGLASTGRLSSEEE